MLPRDHRSDCEEMVDINYNRVGSDGTPPYVSPGDAHGAPGSYALHPARQNAGAPGAASAGVSSTALLEVPSTLRGTWGGCCRSLLNLKPDTSDEPRTVPMGCTLSEWQPRGYPKNAVNNRRYSLFTFLPLALLNQFHNFFNVFYMFLAFSQLVPQLKVGFLFTYFSPLAMVVFLSLTKEALDELKRFRRDYRANQQRYTQLCPGGDTKLIRSCDIKAGDLLVLQQEQRIPADCILLHTSEQNGTTFIRTDQLDGETDWKLRFPLNTTKRLSVEAISTLRANIRCEALHKDIYKFVGVLDTTYGTSEAITPENTLWSECVVASGTLVAVVIHTGVDTRSAMNSARPRVKRGLIESELNYIGVLCFALLVVLSLLLVAHQRFQGDWVIMFIRFFILMSAIIPISMRVNVDVGRLWYSYEIGRDAAIPGAVARNTDLPEELGRLQYLFCDKTGTLTKNKMQMRVLQLSPDVIFSDRDAARMMYDVNEFYGATHDGSYTTQFIRQSMSGQKQLTREVNLVGEALQAMVLCNNVNPVVEEDGHVEFQASSPDEVALVKFCHSLGVTLACRDISTVSYRDPAGVLHVYEVVKLMPFTSERKSMGILLKETVKSEGGMDETVTYRYYMKGADVKMAEVVRPSDWLDESCQELAQIGLRTLVFASRVLTEEQVEQFLRQHELASAVMGSTRADRVEAAMRLVETNMTLLCVTGVEDELQDDVVISLETLGMCGLKIWILTGDKVETATTIGRATRLIPRQATVEYMLCRSVDETWARLGQLQRKYDPAIIGNVMFSPWTLILDGACLSLCLDGRVAELFADVAASAFSVVVARCSPTQKATVVQTMRRFSKPTVRMAAIGDGGNDVSMILAANVGIGIEGVEGKQASMAADFSITKFSDCMRLIMWHGRNAYRRTARLSQFIMHRGIVYSVVQAVFSTLFAGTTMSVFNGYLLMGYSTIFTMAPAFALVLDEDFSESAIYEFPQLYKELVKSRSLNTRTFLQWIWISFFQGGVMMLMSLELFSDDMFQVVTVAYTSLLLTELVIVGSAAHLRTLWRQRRSHFVFFMLAEAVSLAAFFLAVVFLPDTFDRNFFFSWSCWWRVAVISLASIGPLLVFGWVSKYLLFNKRIVTSLTT